MVLLERRIGLLFGLFLGLLLLAGARALWIGGVRGQELSGQTVLGVLGRSITQHRDTLLRRVHFIVA